MTSDAPVDPTAGRAAVRADLQRYPVRPWLREQSVWAVAVHRFGRYVDQLPRSFRRRMLDRFYWLSFRFVETLTGVSLPKEATIGPGLRVWHFGGIFIHPRVVMGSSCTLRQGVTIGVRVDNGPVPVLGDKVDLGAHAQILGGVRIGNHAKIGAMSVVLCDVPDGATAVGNPARVIMKTQAATFEKSV